MSALPQADFSKELFLLYYEGIQISDYLWALWQGGAAFCGGLALQGRILLRSSGSRGSREVLFGKGF